MRKVVLLLLLSLLITGCGMTSKATNEGSGVEQEGIVAGEMVPTLTEKSPLTFQYTVKNQTEQDITLDFTSSQRYDYSVESKEGEVIYLFSSLASFMQVLGEEVVKPAEELVYEFDLNELNLKQGEYVVKAWMTPKDGKKFEVSKTITIN